MLFAAERNRDILTSFLTAVLRPSSPIVVVDITNPTIPGSDEVKRQVILDVHVVLADGRHIDVEMQARREGGPRIRWLFNWGAVFTDQLESGQDFQKAKPVVPIIIMDYAEFEGARFHSTFRVLEVHTHEEYSEHLEIHTLELPKLRKNPPDAAVLNWGKFFAAKTDEELEQLAMNDPHISRANEALKTLSQDPAARELARQRRLAELAYQSGLSEAEAKGEARGEARGEAKGLREAIEHLCQLFEIELDAARAERFSGASAEELLELHDAIAKQQGWPGAES